MWSTITDILSLDNMFLVDVIVEHSKYRFHCMVILYDILFLH